MDTLSPMAGVCPKPASPQFRPGIGERQMKVRLTAELSGTRNGVEWGPVGSLVDLPDDEAQAMIDGGSAVKSDEKDKHPVTPKSVETKAPEAKSEPKSTHLSETKKV